MLDLWYDENTGRLNKDSRGRHLGKFDGDDQVIAFMRNGSYRINSSELSNRFEPEKTLRVEKFDPDKVISAIYVDGESKQHIVKRFEIETASLDKDFGFISESIGSRLVVLTTSDVPEVEVHTVRGKSKEKVKEIINLADLIDVKGWKAFGNRLSPHKVAKVELVADQDDTGLEDGDDENKVIAADEKTKKSDGVPALKKKEYENSLDPGEQANLFAEAPKNQAPSRQQKSEPQKKQAKVEQANLFGEQQNQNPKKESQSQKEKVKKDDSDKGKNFGVGDTIEFSV
jgi:topoisomerase-4 subunit A